MKVRELAERLNALDPELEVLCYSEDNVQVRLLEIINIGSIEGEIIRRDDQVPAIRFGRSPRSKEHAGIELTSDF